MRTKYGVGPIGVIWPADVTLIRRRGVDFEGEKFGVIAGPSFMDAARAGPLEIADNIAVRI
jgi:hypothetical protein